MDTRKQKREASRFMDFDDSERAPTEASAETCKTRDVSVQEVDYSRNKEVERKMTRASGKTGTAVERIQKRGDSPVMEGEDVERKLAEAFAEDFRAKKVSIQESDCSETKDNKIKVVKDLDKSGSVKIAPKRNVNCSAATTEARPKAFNVDISSIDCKIGNKLTEYKGNHAEKRIGVSLKNGTSCNKSNDVFNDKRLDEPNLGSIKNVPMSEVQKDKATVEDKKLKILPKRSENCADASGIAEINKDSGNVAFRSVFDPEYIIKVIDSKGHTYYAKTDLHLHCKKERSKTEVKIDGNRDLIENPDVGQIRPVCIDENKKDNRGTIENPDEVPIRPVCIDENKKGNRGTIENPDVGPIRPVCIDENKKNNRGTIENPSLGNVRQIGVAKEEENRHRIKRQYVYHAPPICVNKNSECKETEEKYDEELQFQFDDL